MTSYHPEFIIDSNNKPKSVVIPVFEWERLLESLEELEDIKAYDAAKSKNDTEISFDAAVKEIRESNTKMIYTIATLF